VGSKKWSLKKIWMKFLHKMSGSGMSKTHHRNGEDSYYNNGVAYSKKHRHHKRR